ncbi:hypothetical protein DPMN_153225, partial [Dreissena polymorpha]
FRPGLLIRVGRSTRHFACYPLSDKQQLSPGSRLPFRPGFLIRVGRIMRHYASKWVCPFKGPFRTNTIYPSEAFKCKLTSRRLPIGMN